MREVHKKGRFWKFFTFFLTSFAVGFFMAIFLINTGKIVIFPEKDVQEIHNDENAEISLSNFWQAYNLIKQNYYAYPQLKKEELENGMIRGIVESLDDKHSEFMDSTEKKQFEDMLTGDFE